MLIRKAIKSDSEAIWKVHYDAIKNVCTSHYTQNQVEVWAGKLKQSSYLESIETKIMFVAEVNSKVVGFGQLNLANSEIEAVYVRSSHLRLGIGKELFQKLEMTAKEKGIRELSLITSLNAVKFYKQLGFIPKNEKTHKIAEDTVLQCVEMEKAI